jgi:hypothetical protein
MAKDTPEIHQRSLFDLWPWLGVLIVLLLVVFVRYRLLDMPLERDEGEYAYAGQLILQGIPPYQMAWNMKMPGTYCADALGMAQFGQTAAGIHATLIIVNSLTIIFVFLLGRRLFGAVAGIAACATFGILSVWACLFDETASDLLLSFWNNVGHLQRTPEQRGFFDCVFEKALFPVPGDDFAFYPGVSFPAGCGGVSEILVLDVYLCACLWDGDERRRGDGKAF